MLSNKRNSMEDRPTKRSGASDAGNSDKKSSAKRGEGESEGGEESVWLSDEMEAIGELKRGAIAARFPEEFSVDSDFLNSQANNVWLPARLHPEIAPGEFQAWLKKHGTQLSKIESTVERRKSVLSYSYSPSEKQEEKVQRKSADENGEPVSYDFQIIGDENGVRRRNTTAMFRVARKKSLMERYADGEITDESPFLVQPSPRSSLKRSKLTNKRRDSTMGRRRRMHSDTMVPSPLHAKSQTADSLSTSDSKPEDAPKAATAAPASKKAADTKVPPIVPPGRVSDSKKSSSPRASDPFDFDFEFETTKKATAPISDPTSKKLSTEEILDQITQEIHELDMKESLTGSSGISQPSSLPRPMSQASSNASSFSNTTPSFSSHSTAPAELKSFPDSTKDKKPAAFSTKTSWWQKGSDDNTLKKRTSDTSIATTSSSTLHADAPSAGDAQKQASGADASNNATSGKKTRLPHQLSFRLFGRNKSKGTAGRGKNGRLSEGSNKYSTNKSGTDSFGGNEKDDGDDANSSTTSTSTATSSAMGSSQGASIPSILTPLRPPPTIAPATASNRLPIYMERAIYRLASIKLTNPRRPLLQQVLLSNMMFWYLGLINPRSPQQPSQPGAQGSPAPSAPPLQSSPQQYQPQQQHQQQQQQQQQNPQIHSAYGTPSMSQDPPQQVPSGYNNHSRSQSEPSNQHYESDTLVNSDLYDVPKAGMSMTPNNRKANNNNNNNKYARHNKRVSPPRQDVPASNQHQRSRNYTRNAPPQGQRRSSQGNSRNSGESVVMQSPQYERQQQQIYGGNKGHGSSGSGGGGSPNMMGTPHSYSGYDNRSRSPSPSSSSTNLNGYNYNRSYSNSNNGYQGVDYSQRSHSPAYSYSSKNSRDPLMEYQNNGRDDEDDDVPLAIYRSTEPNLKSIV